jgi:hypothetical protein
MSRAQSATRIDKLMERASRALTERDYFECERCCVEAMERAHTARDYDRMARICLPLQEARRQRRLVAIDTGRLFQIDEPLSEDEKLESGCYLIEPPLVGADGRDLRERADREEVNICIVVREPKTHLGKWPVVMIGPVTVRTYMDPPADEEHATMEWFIQAGEALGDAAIAAVDSDASSDSRVDQYYDRLGTVTEHEKLHQRLEEACREVAAAIASGEMERPPKRAPSKRRRGLRLMASRESSSEESSDA